MKIGIDISQIAFEHTGVARYVERMVTTLVEKALRMNLFFSDHRFVSITS